MLIFSYVPKVCLVLCTQNSSSPLYLEWVFCALKIVFLMYTQNGLLYAQSGSSVYPIWIIYFRPVCFFLLSTIPRVELLMYPIWIISCLPVWIFLSLNLSSHVCHFLVKSLCNLTDFSFPPVFLLLCFISSTVRGPVPGLKYSILSSR